MPGWVVRCAWCHEDDAPRRLQRCRGCGVGLHGACWRAAGRCPTLGCDQPRPGGALQALTARVWNWVNAWCAGTEGQPTAEVLRDVALDYLGGGDLESALRAAEKAIARDPRAVLSRMVLVDVLLAREEPELAASEALEAIALAGAGDPVPCLQLARVHLARGDQLAADAELDACLDQVAGARRALRRAYAPLRGVCRLLRWDDAGVLSSPPSEATPLTRASALVGLGRWEEAREIVAARVAASPEDRGARQQRIWLSLLLGEPAQALLDVDHLLKSGPCPAPGEWEQAGWARALCGDRETALADLAVGQARWPHATGLALLRRALGDETAGRPLTHPGRPWPAPLLEAVFTNGSPDELLRAADGLPGDRLQLLARQDARVLLGLRAENAGDPEVARVQYRAAAALGITQTGSYVWAYGRLRAAGEPVERRPVFSAPGP